MQVNFDADKNDLLLCRLFALTQSPQVQKQRRKSHLSPLLTYLAVGLFFGLMGEYVIAGSMAVATVGWYFIYPDYERGNYVRRELEHVTRTLAKLPQGETNVVFEDQGFIWSEKGLESKISFELLEQVVETGHALYLVLKSESILPLPKDKIPQSEALVTYLKSATTRLQIPYQAQPHWVWR